MWIQGRIVASLPRIAKQALISRLGVMLLFGIMSANIVHAVVELPEENSLEQNQLPALGISKTFGRWIDTVNLRYIPSGAHPEYLDNAHMIELITEAAARWERVSGIRFDIALDVGQSAREGEVPVFWEHAPGEGWAGWAGPHFGSYDDSRGYYAYSEGTVKLNSSLEHITDTSLLRTLTHELGHLIGLGHSENPNSMMFANPYNSLQYPMEDDIRAVQVLYGASESSPDTSFVPPPAASAEKVQQILKTDRTGVIFTTPVTSDMLHSETTSHVYDDSPDSDTLSLRIAFQSSDASKLVSYYLVRPDGVLFGARQSCVTGCSFSFPQLGSISSFKKVPGTWRVYIAEDAQFVESPELLYSTSFEVDTYYQYNRTPMARLVVEPGNAPNSVNVQVHADDFEGDNISVLWHLPGPRIDRDGDRILDNYLTEKLGRNTQSAWQQINFQRPGTHELFIQVNDDATRYEEIALSGISSGAGAGFQTLLKLTVTVPIRSDADIQVVSSYTPDGDRRWLSTLNGVQPAPQYKLPFQRIGLIGDDYRRLYSCVRVTTNGALDPAFGPNMDVTFLITSLEQGDIRLHASRRSNAVPGANQSHARCSGHFETTTGIYTDVIRLDEQVLDVEFTLVDEQSLTFQLIGGGEVEAIDH